MVLLTDDFLKEINEHLPKLTQLDLQQCPNLTDSYLEQIVRQSEGRLEIINYYGESIQSITSDCDSDLSDGDSSTTEEAKSDDISLDISFWKSYHSLLQLALNEIENVSI